MFANLDEYANQIPSGLKSRQVRVGAVTAPGSDQLDWDTNRCAGLGAHRHSGDLGCRVRYWEGSNWNRTAPARWRGLHGEAYRRTVREGLKPWLLLRVWEMQKRGLLHAHPVLAYSTPQERRSADRYLAHLDDLRHRYGFGFVERKKRVREPRAAAAYLSSYFVNGKGRKATLEKSVQSNAMPRSIIHVSTRLTRASGVTMRNLRLNRYRWILYRVIEKYWEYIGEVPQDLEVRYDEVSTALARAP